MSEFDKPDPQAVSAGPEGPKTIQISAKSIRQDIKARMSDRDLMKKYGISAKNLERIKRTLLVNRLLTEEELKNQGSPAAPEGKRLQANEFVDAFRKFPDDFYLMKKFSLNPKQLGKVYATLMDKNLISEFEFHCRVGQTPELEDPNASHLPEAASTVVSLIEKTVDEITERFMDDDEGVPKDLFRDHSGITLGRAKRKEPAPVKDRRRLVQASSVVVEVGATGLGAD